jgi:hypothetical protein
MAPAVRAHPGTLAHKEDLWTVRGYLFLSEIRSPQHPTTPRIFESVVYAPAMKASSTSAVSPNRTAKRSRSSRPFRVIVASLAKLKARRRISLSLSTEFRIFGALVVFVGAVTLAGIALDIYLHPPGPSEVGTATVVFSGEGRFSGIVGTDSNNYTIKATSPATVKVPYSLEDYVIADVAPVENSDRYPSG